MTPILWKCEHGNPELHAAVKNEHDPVAFDQPLREHGGGETVRGLFEKSEIIGMCGAVVLNVNHGRGGWFFFGQAVHDVVGEIIIFRDLHAEVAEKIFITCWGETLHHKLLWLEARL